MSVSTPPLVPTSTCSSSPVESPFRSSSPVDEDDEMECLMCSSPIPPDDDDEQPNTGQPEGMVQPGEPVSILEEDPDQNNLSLLHDLLQDFVKCSLAARDAQLHMAIFSIDNRLEEQAAAAPAFSSLVMRDRLHIPNTFDRDPHTSKVLKEHVNHKLSQAQGKLKKLIKSGNDKNIFDLATMLVTGTLCAITVSLCGHVALFCKVFKIDLSDKFWDSVDEELVKIRKKSNNDPVKVTHYFKAILDTDQKKYVGDASSEAYTIPVSYSSADLWQAGVDALLTGNAST